MKTIKHFILAIDEDSGLCMVDWRAFAEKLKNEKGAKIQLNTTDGTSMASYWPADVRLTITSSSPAPGAALGNYGSVLLVNQSVKLVMEEVCKGSEIEFLPLTVMDKKKKVTGGQYYLVNPLGTYDAIDAVESDIDWNEDGTIDDVENLVLNYQKAVSAPPLFRLQYAPATIIMNYDLVYAIYQHAPELLYTEQLYSSSGEQKQQAAGKEQSETISTEQMAISMQLVEAVMKGKADIVESLLDKKPLLDLPNRTRYGIGEPAIIHAAQKGYDNILKMLIDAGASLDIGDEENRTALFHAVQQNKLSCVKELLKAGANPNICRQKNKKIIDSPLAKAISMNFRPIVKLLLAHKADPNLKDENGKIPFHAAKDGDEEMYRWLLDAGTDINSSSIDFSPPLHILAGHASLSLLQIAIEKGGKINNKDGFNKSTPLMEAAENGKLENIKYLLSLNADPNLKDRSKKTAVQLAFENKHYSIVEYLSSTGVSVDEKIQKQTKSLQQIRTEFAFDLYAKEIADKIVSIVLKNSKKTRFDASRLEVYFDDDWQLISFSLSGKETDFSHTVSADDAVPAGFDKKTQQRLFTPFLQQFRLKARSISPEPILYWQLYKTIHQQLPAIAGSLHELMILNESNDRYYNFSSLHRAVRSSLSLLAEKPELLKEYAVNCLKQKTEQEALEQLFKAVSNTYAMDLFANSIVESAVKQITDKKNIIDEPVQKITLQYVDFGALLPSFIRLQFQKGPSQSWTLARPESTLPDHIDFIDSQDFLLPAFIKKHKLKNNVPEWGDINDIPTCLLRLEFLLAGQKVLEKLKEHGIPLAPKASAYIGDGEDDCDDIPGYTRQVRKEISTKLHDGKLLKAFSELCYQTEEKQQWLQGLKEL